MNEKKKAKIIDECLNAISQGTRSAQDCINMYPKLEQELVEIINISSSLKEYKLTQRESQKLKRIKDRIMFNLVDRDTLVTKPMQIRYKWHNTKRRFAMGWVIIITTIVSLISGAGVVSASNSALPGDTLYPVKTWVEDVQLAISPDEIDAKLAEKFASERLKEMVQLFDAGENEEFGQLAEGYHNRTELMAQSMMKIEAKNPDEAIKLRNELEFGLMEQARVIEGFLQKENGEGNNQLQERLQEMLQTNMRVRLRSSETVLPEVSDLTNEEIDEISESSEDSTTTDTAENVQNQNQNNNQNQVKNVPDEFLENGALKFRFEFRQILDGGIFAMVDGARYDCVTDGDQAICDLTGVSGKGNLSLFAKNTNLLLYSYNYDHNYEYLWEGKKDNGNEIHLQEGSQDGEGGHENGQGGKK